MPPVEIIEWRINEISAGQFATKAGFKTADAQLIVVHFWNVPRCPFPNPALEQVEFAICISTAVATGKCISTAVATGHRPSRSRLAKPSAILSTHSTPGGLAKGLGSIHPVPLGLAATVSASLASDERSDTPRR